MRVDQLTVGAPARGWSEVRALQEIRKTLLIRELIRADSYATPCDPICRVAALAVIGNPLAGRYEASLSPLFEIGAQLGQLLAEEAAGQLNGPAVSYGKAAIVGSNGDMEHGGAVIHPRLGAPMRAAVGGGEAVIPSNVKVGTPGAAIDVPLGHKDNPWSFDHFDTLTVSVPDGPRADELVIIVAYADGGRVLPRCGTGPIQS